MPVYNTIVIVGGGCYGTFYARQLALARKRGKGTYGEVLLVDRDAACRVAREVGGVPAQRLVVSEWGQFFDHWLDPALRQPHDVIVPSPLMPHLLYEWVLRRAQARWPGREVVTRPITEPIGTPYDMLAPDGTRYVSFADWICPTHCVEPAVCPVTGAPRTWEMAEALTSAARRSRRTGHVVGPVLFHCAHQVHGVGAIAAREVLEGDAVVRTAGSEAAEVDILVATVSGCHGAANLLHLGVGTG